MQAARAPAADWRGAALSELVPAHIERLCSVKVCYFNSHREIEIIVVCLETSKGLLSVFIIFYCSTMYSNYDYRFLAFADAQQMLVHISLAPRELLRISVCI